MRPGRNPLSTSARAARRRAGLARRFSLAAHRDRKSLVIVEALDAVIDWHETGVSSWSDRRG